MAVRDERNLANLFYFKLSCFTLIASIPCLVVLLPSYWVSMFIYHLGETDVDVYRDRADSPTTSIVDPRGRGNKVRRTDGHLDKFHNHSFCTHNVLTHNPQRQTVNKIPPI